MQSPHAAHDCKIIANSLLDVVSILLPDCLIVVFGDKKHMYQPNELLVNHHPLYTFLQALWSSTYADLCSIYCRCGAV